MARYLAEGFRGAVPFPIMMPPNPQVLPMPRRPVVAAAVVACTVAVACNGNELLLPGDTRPVDLAIVNGNFQTGGMGLPLGKLLVVQVINSRGQPIEGQNVAFVVATGEGRLE